VADLKNPGRVSQARTPILMHDFMNTENEAGTIGVKRAAQEWEAAGHRPVHGLLWLLCALYRERHRESRPSP